MISTSARRSLRNRRIRYAVWAGMIARSAQVISGLLIVPVALPYFGIEQFGIWMALTGCVAFLSFTDMGVGIGLQNRLTECHGRDDRIRPQALITAALLLMVLAGLVLVSLSLWILPATPLDTLIVVSSADATAVLLSTAQVVMLVFAVGLPCGLVQRVLDAYQYSYISHVLLGTGRLLALLGVWVCIACDGTLPMAVGIYMGMPVAVLGLAGGVLLARSPWLRPGSRALDRAGFRAVAGLGGTAFAAQLAFTVMASGSVLVLTSQFGAAAIVPFAITQRLFGVGTFALAALLGPLWPAYGEAMARGDVEWLRRAYTRSLQVSAAFAVLGFGLALLLGQDLIGYWAQRPAAVPESSLLLALGVWFLVQTWSRPHAMLLNGLGRFRGQAVYGMTFAVIACVMGYLAASFVGLTSTVWIMVLFGELPRVILLGLESRRAVGRLVT